MAAGAQFAGYKSFVPLIVSQQLTGASKLFELNRRVWNLSFDQNPSYTLGGMDARRVTRSDGALRQEAVESVS